MHFLSFGDGHAGGVCSFTDYLKANDDGAWVGLERYPHPVDSQYSWTSRLAEVYSARNKSFCRHNACIESILQEVSQTLSMYDFDDCYYFIGLPSWKRKLFPLYGDWGSAKDHLWSSTLHSFGVDCKMDGTDFDREYGKQLIIEMLRTNGVRPKDTTFKSWYDRRFASIITKNELNLGDLYDPMVSYHPDDDRFTKIIDIWLDTCEQEYLKECERIENIEEDDTMSKNIHFIFDLINLLKKAKDTKHKFYFYFTEHTWPLPSDDDIISSSTHFTGDLKPEELEEVIVKLNYPNVHWLWNVCMTRFFNEDLDNARPKTKGYFKHEDHYQFSRHMRKHLIDNSLI